MRGLMGILVTGLTVLAVIYVYNAFIAEKDGAGKNVKTIANLGTK